MLGWCWKTWAPSPCRFKSGGAESDEPVPPRRNGRKKHWSGRLLFPAHLPQGPILLYILFLGSQPAKQEDHWPGLTSHLGHRRFGRR
jgi:hypothetical protein